MSLKRRIPLLRWSFWRLAASVRNVSTAGTGQIGDGREAAAVDYVLKRNLMRLPAGWSDAEGSAFRVGATTAYHSLVHRAQLKQREVLLVLGVHRVGEQAPQVQGEVTAIAKPDGEFTQQRRLGGGE